MLNLFNYNSLQCSLAIGMLHWWYQSLSNFGSTVLLTDVDTCVCVNTCVISRDAAAALIWRLGCLTELLQSNARANVPTDLTNTNESIQIELHSGQNEVTPSAEWVLLQTWTQQETGQLHGLSSCDLCSKSWFQEGTNPEYRWLL